MPPGCREAIRTALQRFDDRHAVQDGQVRDGVGMIQGHSKSGIVAAIMSDQGEAREPETAHQRDAIGRLGPL